MASYNSYGSASSRRSHMSHHQPPQTIVWSLPTVQGVQGPPSALYATYFPPNPHMKYHPRHYSYSPSAMAPIYPAPMPTHPNPSRTRRQSTGDGPRVSPHIIEPTPSYHAQSNSHSRVHPPAPQPAHSYSHLTRKSILKPSKVAPPPQTPYVMPHSVRAPRPRGSSFSSMKNLFVKQRTPPAHGPPATVPRRVRFAEDTEPWRRR